MNDSSHSPRRLRLGMVGGGTGAYIGNMHRIASRLDAQFDLVAGAFDVDPARAEGMDMTVAFRFATDAFAAKLAGGELEIERAHDIRKTDLVFEAASPNAILPYFYGKRPLAEVEAETGLVVKGDRALADRFAGLFRLPAKVDLPAT